MKNLSKYIILALCGTMLFVQCDILNPPITFSTTSGNVLGVFPNGTLSPLDSVKIEVDGSVRDISKADGTFSVSGLTAGKSYRFRLLGRGDLLLDSTITIQANDASLPKDKQTAKALSLKVRLTGKELDARFFRFPLAVGNQWNYEVNEIRKTIYNGMTAISSDSWKASITISGKSSQNQDILWAADVTENQYHWQYNFKQTDTLLFLWNYVPLVSADKLFQYGFNPQIPMFKERRIIAPNDTLSQIVAVHAPMGNARAKIVHTIGIVEIYDVEGFRANDGYAVTRETTYTLKSYTLK